MQSDPNTRDELLSECIRRKARQPWVCTGSGGNPPRFADRCVGIIGAGQRYVEYVGGAAAYQSGSRHCLACAAEFYTDGEEGRTVIIHLERGAHASRDDGMSVTEYWACRAGEPHSHRPECVCPVIATYAQRLNDAMPDDERQTLLELDDLALGTANDGRQQERMFMCTDWAVRTALPMALDIGSPQWAERLRGLAEIVDRDTALAVYYVALRGGAVGFAPDAALAVDAAASGAAREAAGAAGDTASGVGRLAAETVAYAARSQLQPAVVWQSARDLLERMCALRGEQ